MPTGLKVSRPLIANMILVVNISNFVSEILFMLWHLASHVGIMETIVLRSSMQGENIIEQVSCVYVVVCKRRIVAY